MLVIGLCVWKWTSSVTTLDPNQNCSIGFDGSASGNVQSLACTRKLCKFMQKFRGTAQDTRYKKLYLTSVIVKQLT